MEDKTTKNNVTELVFILDRSGSMAGLESDTIGGFNAMIEKQKKQVGECYVSTVFFDNVSEVLHDRVKLSEIKPMRDKDYTVRGCTALIDAVGGAIHHIGNVHKYARPEDVPEHTMFSITTDGMENASRRYSSDKARAMIERQKEKYGWEFLFIGANIDAVETAARYGIGADRAVNYNADKEGTSIVYESVVKAVCNVRACAPLSVDWSNNINEDYIRRDNNTFVVPTSPDNILLYDYESGSSDFLFTVSKSGMPEKVKGKLNVKYKKIRTLS